MNKLSRVTAALVAITRSSPVLRTLSPGRREKPGQPPTGGTGIPGVGQFGLAGPLPAGVGETSALLSWSSGEHVIAVSGGREMP
jgi:hypothetical protein